MLIAARNAMLAGGGSQPSGGYWGLCFTAEQANSTVAMTKRGTMTNQPTLLFSTDPTNQNGWTQFVPGTTTITLDNIGDKVWIKAGEGGNIKFWQTALKYVRFSLNTGLVAASGNIMSLLNGDAQTYSFPDNNTFRQMFYNCTSLTAAPSLPATTLADNCYYSMFNGCTGLTAAPSLPATTLANSCYYSMFRGCTNIATVHAQMESWGEASAGGDYPTESWLSNVAATGTFYCPTALGTDETIERGSSRCPAGWTVINTDA